MATKEIFEIKRAFSKGIDSGELASSIVDPDLQTGEDNWFGQFMLEMDETSDSDILNQEHVFKCGFVLGYYRHSDSIEDSEDRKLFSIAEHMESCMPRLM